MYRQIWKFVFLYRGIINKNMIYSDIQHVIKDNIKCVVAYSKYMLHGKVFRTHPPTISIICFHATVR